MTQSKILFVIPEVGPGGAEKVQILMANYWAEKDLDVNILSFTNSKPFYSISEKVNLFHEKIAIGFFNVPRFILSIRQHIKKIKPDVVISFITSNNVLSILASIKLKNQIIISERTNPLLDNRINYRWAFLRKHLYRYADSFVVQTKEAQNVFTEIIPSLPKTVIIENPLDKKYSTNDKSSKSKIILAVGRFTKEKGHLQLIDAFSKIKDTDWKLNIVGDGPLRKSYEEKIIEYNLMDRVILTGKQKDVYTYYSKASIFTLTSSYEGFPNALCEAMAMGCAVVSYNCSMGPKELIQHGQNGLLVQRNDVVQLQQSIQLLINNQDYREKLALNAQEIIHRLNINTIMKKWGALIINNQ